MRNWGFDGGSIDSLNFFFFSRIPNSIFFFLKFSSNFKQSEWTHLNMNKKFRPLEINLLARILEKCLGNSYFDQNSREVQNKVWHQNNFSKLKQYSNLSHHTPQQNKKDWSAQECDYNYWKVLKITRILMYILTPREFGF
jgi:hypothetical protein